MKNKKTADLYNKIYSDDDKAFSGEELPLAQRLAESLSVGATILDLGAGSGRNALFFARKGFQVTAVDISPHGLERLVVTAKEQGLLLKTICADISEFKFGEQFDAIVCFFVLHHLNTRDATAVIQNMKLHTNPGGFNSMTAFTKDGDFFRTNPGTGRFYLNNKVELNGYFTDWKTISLFEKEGKARAMNNKGNPQFNVFAGIMAQKSPE